MDFFQELDKNFSKIKIPQNLRDLKFCKNLYFSKYKIIFLQFLIKIWTEFFTNRVDKFFLFKNKFIFRSFITELYKLIHPIKTRAVQISKIKIQKLFFPSCKRIRPLFILRHHIFYHFVCNLKIQIRNPIWKLKTEEFFLLDRLGQKSLFMQTHRNLIIRRENINGQITRNAAVDILDTIDFIWFNKNRKAHTRTHRVQHRTRIKNLPLARFEVSSDDFERNFEFFKSCISKVFFESRLHLFALQKEKIPVHIHHFRIIHFTSNGNEFIGRFSHCKERADQRTHTRTRNFGDFYIFFSEVFEDADMRIALRRPAPKGNSVFWHNFLKFLQLYEKIFVCKFFMGKFLNFCKIFYCKFFKKFTWHLGSDFYFYDCIFL